MHKRAYLLILVTGLLIVGGGLLIAKNQHAPAILPQPTAIPTARPGNSQAYRPPPATRTSPPPIARTPLAQVAGTVQAFPQAIATALAPPPYLPAFPPAPTPIADLALLTQKSGSVARMRVSGTNGAQHSIILYGEVLEWITTPDQGPLKQISVWVSMPVDGYDRSAIPTAPRDGYEGEEYIVFLRKGRLIQSDGAYNYWVTDMDAALFRVRGGKIDWGGIPRYNGWTLAAFEQEIRSLARAP